MKVGGHHIASRIKGRVAQVHNRIVRARYFRGHGVHSPFVYDLVRCVFMRRELLPGDRKLFLALLAAGIPARRAMQLQNLATHCGYASFGLNRADAALCILTRNLPRAEVLEIVHAAAQTGHDVVVMSPYDNRERQGLCYQLVAEHNSTTVDNRAYLLILNNHLPKQHFRI